MWPRVGGGLVLWALLTGFSFSTIQGQQGDVDEVFRERSLSIRVEYAAGLKAAPLEWVRHALENHEWGADPARFIGTDFPVMITDGQVYLQGVPVVAVTVSAGFILLGGFSDLDRAAVEETVLHELAHAMADRIMTDRTWADYARVRRLGPEYRDSSWWHRRPSEVFAEDFARLFGTAWARQSRWPFNDLVLPDEVPGLREFFLGLTRAKAAVEAPDAQAEPGGSRRPAPSGAISGAPVRSPRANFAL